jgi:hypothetical protein
LFECARRYEEARPNALARNRLWIAQRRLTSGHQGNFSNLVRKFLRGFRVPPAVIDLSRAVAKPPLTGEGWQWLQTLSVAGTVTEYSRGAVPPGAPPETILEIEESDAVLDVIHPPVMALLDLVDMLAEQWERIAALGASVFHQHNMASTFYAYVDEQVASFYLTFTDGSFPGIVAPKFRYRAVTAVGVDPEDERTWGMFQEVARRQARTTFGPIDEGRR